MKVILGHISVSWPLFQERLVVNLDRFNCSNIYKQLCQQQLHANL